MDHRPTSQQQQNSKPRQPSSVRHELYVRDSSYESHSTDRDDEEEDYEISFLEACMDCDDDALYDIIRDGVTREQVNERDKSGRTGLSHASSNGFVPILELLGSLDDLDPNLADNDGNSALIYAAQAGHDDVVSFLLQNMRNVRVDQCNKMGFTPLMKAAIQGRTRCAKLLLFAGASPNRRDHGRGLCAEEWARFCGCHSCANSIAKYVRSKKYFFKKTFLLSKDKWSSEPDILNCTKRGSGTGGVEKPTSWIQRHLSLKKKKGRGQPGNKNTATLESSADNNSDSLSTAANKFGSAPILLINSYEEDIIDKSAKNFRRPSCIDNVVPVSIGRRRHLPDDSESGERSNKSIVRNSPPSSTDAKSAMTHKSNDNNVNFDGDNNIDQRKNSKELHEPPPRITVGGLACDEAQQTGSVFPVIEASTSATVAPPIGAFLPSKAVAVADAVRHKSSRSGSVVECRMSNEGMSRLSIHDL